MNFNLPIEIGQKFRKMIIENFRSIDYAYRNLSEVIYKHKNLDKHAHDASQIDYADTSVDKHLKYQNKRISRLVLGHNGDGIQELTDSRVAIDGEPFNVLSERLYYDFNKINKTMEDNYNSLNKKIERIINVNDYGADPTGQEDSTEAFKKAFANGGRHVHMTEGTYIISGLKVPNNTVLSGMSPYNTILKVADNAPRETIGVTNKNLDGTAENIIFENFSVDGNKGRFTDRNISGGVQYEHPKPSGGSLSSAVRLAGVTNGQIRNVRAYDALLHGIDITHASDSYIASGDGVRVREDLESKYILIDNCETYHNGDDGITTHHSRYISIKNCISHEPKNYHGNSNGIEVDDGSQFVFLDNNYTYGNHVGLEIKAHDTTSAPTGVFVNSHISCNDTRSYVLRHIGHHRAETDVKTKTANDVMLNNCVALYPTETGVYPGWKTRALSISAYRNVSVNNFTAIGDGTYTAGEPVVIVQFMAENIQFNNLNISGFKNASSDFKVLGGVNRPKKISASNINIRHSSNNIGIFGGAKVYDLKIIGANLIGNGKGTAVQLPNRNSDIIGIKAEGYTNQAKIIDKFYREIPSVLHGGFIGGSTGSGALSPRSAVLASSGNTFAYSDRSWAMGSGAENHVRGSRTGIVNSLRSETKDDGVAQMIVNSHRVKSPSSHVIVGGWGGSGKASTENVKFTISSYTGNAFFAGKVQSGQNFGDYAEYFESQSGQEIPNGYIVTLDGRYIRKANGKDKPIGVISGTAGVILGDQMFHHKDKYLKDEFGVRLTEEMESEIVKDNGEVIKEIRETPILNPEWEEKDEEYQSRAERPEWNVVGLMGQIFTRIDDTVSVNDYIKPTKGIGTKDNNNGFYRVLEITTPYDSEKGYGVAVVLVK